MSPPPLPASSNPGTTTVPSPAMSATDSWLITQTTYKLSGAGETLFYAIRFSNDPNGIITAALRTHGKRVYLTEDGPSLKVVFASHTDVPLAPDGNAPSGAGTFAAVNDYLYLTATHVASLSNSSTVSWKRVAHRFSSNNNVPAVQEGSTSILFVPPSVATTRIDVAYHPPPTVATHTAAVSWSSKVAAFQVLLFVVVAVVCVLAC